MAKKKKGLGTFVVNISGNLKGLEKALNKAKKRLDKFAKNAGKAMKAVGKAFSIAGGAISTGLGFITKSTADAGDQIQKLAIKTGLSTETLSELKFAAEQSGASIESLGKGMKTMASFVDDANAGLSTQKRDLEGMGLTLEDIKGLSPEETFNTFANAISRVEDPLKRAALAQGIFGRAGTELLPLFAQGASGMEALRKEARELGLIFDQDAANASAKFNDSLNSLKTGIGALKNSVGLVLIDALNPFIDRITELLKPIREWIAGNKELFAKIILITGAIGVFMAVIGPVLFVLPGIVLAITALFSPLGLIIGLIGGALIAALGFATREGETFQEKLVILRDKAVALADAILPKIKEFAEVALPKIKAALSVAFQFVVVTAEQLMAFWEKWGTTIVNGARATIGAIITLLGAVWTVLINVGQFLVNVFTGQWGAAWDQIKDLVGLTLDGMKAQFLAWFDFVRSGLSRLWESIPEPLRRLIAGGANVVSGLVKSVIPGLAHGGKVVREGLALVGEQGPEIVRLSRGAEVIPNKGGIAAQSGVSITNNFDLRGVTVRSDDDLHNIREGISREFQRVFNQELRGLGLPV